MQAPTLCVAGGVQLGRPRHSSFGTQSVGPCIPTQSVGTRRHCSLSLVPTLCVGMQAPTLCVAVDAHSKRPCLTYFGTQSVRTCVPTQSVGTRRHCSLLIVRSSLFVAF